MNTFVVLIRGINVGGKNKVSMTELKKYLLERGFHDVLTYINSGNIILRSNQQATEIQTEIEALLPKRFHLDSGYIKVLVLSKDRFKAVVDGRPTGFGDEPETYHSDVIFLMDIESTHAFAAFSPKDGVDTVWQGVDAIYSQRLSAQRTKSRLNKIMSSPLYKSMTIRNWNTTVKLLAMLN